jgi:hypothetical protein
VRRSALDGYATADRMAEVGRAGGADNRYPATDLGKQMALMAGLIKGGVARAVTTPASPATISTPPSSGRTRTCCASCPGR